MLKLVNYKSHFILGETMKNRNYQFTNGIITIRPHQLDDSEPSFVAIRESVNELMPWMYWCHADISLQEAKDWIEFRPQTWKDDMGYHFAIIDSSNGSFLGNCGLDHIDLQNEMAELGYWVRTSRTNQGIATSATKLVFEFVFDVLKLNRIEIVIAVENLKSQRVAEKLGAQKEGLLRRRLNVRGIIHDAYLFSVIRDNLD